MEAGKARRVTAANLWIRLSVQQSESKGVQRKNEKVCRISINSSRRSSGGLLPSFIDYPFHRTSVCLIIRLCCFWSMEILIDLLSEVCVNIVSIG